MKFLFYGEYIKNHLCITRIRFPNKFPWYHFKRSDYSINNHNNIIGKTFLGHNFKTAKGITIDLKDDDLVLKYFDAINEKFWFNNIHLEEGIIN